jgi:hypothetical protein
VVEMVQKLVLRNEVVKVKGRVKVITVKKDEFEKFLQLRKLRILDKEYEALMPPLDGLQKNTIDVNGLATLMQQYLYYLYVLRGVTNNPTSPTSPAQMVLTTQSGSITLSYSGSIGLNSQGVTVYMQVLQESGSWTFQYYYVGFDTTNNSYSTSQLELYVSAYIYTLIGNFYTNTVRIAYTNASFSKYNHRLTHIILVVMYYMSHS